MFSGSAVVSVPGSACFSLHRSAVHSAGGCAALNWQLIYRLHEHLASCNKPSMSFHSNDTVCTQEERYVHYFTAAVNAATNTYNAGTAAQNALSVVGKFDSVKAMCELLQQHFHQLEECVALRSRVCILLHTAL